jgi:hypothetical protein
MKSFHPQPTYADVTTHGGQDNRNYILYQMCPSCKSLLLYLKQKINQQTLMTFLQGDVDQLDKFGVLIHPKKKRKPLSNDIPNDHQKDFYEASDILEISPKASAALSRYCLQRLLVEKAGVKKRDLSDQIQEVLDSKQLPTHLASDIDAIRAIGNFGAHPIKSTNSGTIIDIEEGEAEWNISVLEGLFDFYFVAPAESKRKKDALNQKLQQAGKPSLR